MKKLRRTETVVGYTHKGWRFELEDFGMIVLPLLNKTKRRPVDIKVEVTVKEI